MLAPKPGLEVQELPTARDLLQGGRLSFQCEVF